MRRILAPTLLTCALAAADGPLAEAVAPDLGRTITRVEQGMWGKTWNDPALAGWRAQAASAAAEAKAELGMDVLAILRSAKDGRIVLDRLEAKDGKPDAAFQGQIRMGAAADTVWAALTKAVKAAKTSEAVPGADAVITAENNGDLAATFARFKDVIAVGHPAAGLAVRPVSALDADITVRLDQARLQAAMQQIQAEDNPAIAKAGADLMARHPELFTELVWTMTAVPEGFHERIVSGANPAAIPVDRAVLDRLPANTLAVLAAGVDGAKAWDLFAPYVLDLITGTINQKGGEESTPDGLLSQADAFLQMQGLEFGVKAMVSGMRGTVVLAVTPSMPFPAVTLAVPRSPGIDALVRWALGQAGLEAPADGTPLPISLPNVPVAPTLIADKGHWLISTDGLVANAWASGEPGGFATGKAGAEALKRAPADASVIGASDTPAVLRTIAGFLALAPIQDRKQKQQLMTAMNKLAGNAATGWLWSRSGTDKSEAELRGIAGSIALPAVIAAIAIPNLMESRTTAERAAAAATLKSGMFPAEIQFQAGGYRDQDGDNRGEYGLIGHLAGDTDEAVGPKRALSLVIADYQGVDPIRNGYQYRIYLPTAADNGSADPAEVNAATDPAAIDLREQWFVAYTWPVDGEGKVFALTVTGMVYQADVEMVGEPAWNSLFGDKGWGTEIDDSVWSPYQR
jgi:hypothetical protein